MNIKKFILHPIAKPKPKIDSSKIFFEKKNAPMEKNKNAHEQSIGSRFSKNKIGLESDKIKNILNLSKSIFF